MRFAGRSGGVDFSSAGRVVFDGKGSATIYDTFTFDGAATRGRQTAATYTVGPDCAGTLTLSVWPPLTADFVIGDQGKRLYLIQTDAGATVSGEAVQQ